MTGLKAYMAQPVIGFISPRVAEVLGLARGRNQATIVVFAASKAAASRLLDARRMSISTREPSFREQADDPFVLELRSAGLDTEPSVYATPPTGAQRNGVVRIDGTGVGVLIGHMERGSAPWERRFVPASTPADEEVDLAALGAEDRELVDRCGLVQQRLDALQSQLNLALAERQALVTEVVERKLTAPAAARMGLSPGRLYQIRRPAGATVPPAPVSPQD